MKEFNAEQVQVETASALESVLKAGEVHCFGVYVGLDVHKDTIALTLTGIHPCVLTKMDPIDR